MNLSLIGQKHILHPIQSPFLVMPSADIWGWFYKSPICCRATQSSDPVETFNFYIFHIFITAYNYCYIDPFTIVLLLSFRLDNSTWQYWFFFPTKILLLITIIIQMCMSLNVEARKRHFNPNHLSPRRVLMPAHTCIPGPDNKMTSSTLQFLLLHSSLKWRAENGMRGFSLLSPGFGKSLVEQWRS